MATKDEILQRVNTICEEHKFNLVDTNKEKFSEKASERFKDVSIDDENLINDLTFALESAYHFQSGALKKESEIWKEKENKYIAQLKDVKSDKSSTMEKDDKVEEMPENLKKMYEWYEHESKVRALEEKRKSIFSIATKDMDSKRKDAFKEFLNTQGIDESASNDDVAKETLGKFNKIFKMSIVETNPYSSETLNKGDEELLSSISKDFKIKV